MAQSQPNGRVTYINSDEMDLGVSVLSGLGGGHVDDLLRAMSEKQAWKSIGGDETHLAWSALDDDVSVLSESRAL